MCVVWLGGGMSLGDAHQREYDGVSKDRVFPSGETAAMYNVTGILEIRVCREMP